MSFRDRCPASKVFFLLAGQRSLMPRPSDNYQGIMTESLGFIPLTQEFNRRINHEPTVSNRARFRVSEKNMGYL
jgi:hypothetical protein